MARIRAWRGGGGAPGGGVAIACLALLLAAALAACSKPRPFEPAAVSSASLAGRTVSWTSTRPSLGSVRWGDRAGRYDHVAYPAPPADRAFVTEHHVPLLAPQAGDSVYLQVLARAADGATAGGGDQAFRLADPPANGALLTWTMIDVGFGDSHLLTMPTHGARVLVDGGERRDAANVGRFLADAGVDRLDAALLTHIHEDHVGGMVGNSWLPGDGVVGETAVGAVLEGRDPSGTRAAYRELVTLCGAREIPRRTLAPGDRDGTNPAIAWDPQVRVTVLNAGDGRSIGGVDESDWINNDSVVLRLTYGAVSFVLGGDAQSPVESKLLGEQATLEASVLKVHHHGSANASDARYLAAVHPRVALIPMTRDESIGGTLPSGIVLQRLREAGADVYGSDRAEPLGLLDSGDAGENVTVTTDGRSYEVAVARSASSHWPPEARGRSTGSLP